MNYSIQSILTELRSKQTTRDHFRYAADRLSEALAFETYEKLPKTSFNIETPISKSEGIKLKNHQVLIPILRSGLAMLYPFLKVFDQAKVGFLGMRRDEVTCEPHLYYENLPPIDKNDDVLILDPMIATGGSGALALEIIQNLKIDLTNVYYIGMVAAPEGITRLKKFPIQMVVGSIDEKLNDKKFIVPGLGDFGDRYFGTES